MYIYGSSVATSPYEQTVFYGAEKNIVNMCCTIQSLLQQIPKIVILQTQPTPLTENQCVLVAFTMRSAYSTGLITLNIFLL
jgi:hypothetical protein